MGVVHMINQLAMVVLWSSQERTTLFSKYTTIWVTRNENLLWRELKSNLVEKWSGLASCVLRCMHLFTIVANIHAHFCLTDVTAKLRKCSLWGIDWNFSKINGESSFGRMLSGSTRIIQIVFIWLTEQRSSKRWLGKWKSQEVKWKSPLSIFVGK